MESSWNTEKRLKGISTQDFGVSETCYSCSKEVLREPKPENREYGPTLGPSQNLSPRAGHGPRERSAHPRSPRLQTGSECLGNTTGSAAIIQQSTI